MLLMIMFLLIAIFAIFGFLHSLRDKNLLGLAFSFGAIVVFGWFSIMTLINSGFPTAH